MVVFPETAISEWQRVADSAEIPKKLADRIQHDVEVELAAKRLHIRHEADILFRQQLDAEDTPVLEMGTLTELAQSPSMSAPADLIDGVLKDSGVCLVLGPSSAGKSTMAMQIIHSLNTGTSWLGQPVSPITGGFGVLSYDMDFRMFGAILQQYPNLDLDKVSLVQAHKQGNPLGVLDFRKKIAAAWKKMNVEVVIIDSFSASFQGKDQNDAGATMAHYRDLKQFALVECEAKVVIIIVHSTNSNPHQARGSSVHHDVADSIIGISIEPTSNQREIRMVKYRAAPGQTEMAPVIVTDPDASTHLVSVDPSAMTLAGMPIPARINSSMFSSSLSPFAAPDTDSGDDDG